MNIVRILPALQTLDRSYTSADGDVLPNYSIKVSKDQTRLTLSAILPPVERSFLFDRVFSQNYTMSSLYDQALAEAADDFLFDRRSRGVVCMGASKAGKTYTACAIVRRVLLACIKRLGEGASVTLDTSAHSESSTLARTSILDSSFYGSANTVPVETALGKVVQEYTLLQGASSSPEQMCLVYRLRAQTGAAVFKVIEAHSENTRFAQGLQRFLNEQNLLALRASKGLFHLRELFSTENTVYSAAEACVDVVHCIANEAMVNYRRQAAAGVFRRTMRHLAFGELLTAKNAIGAGAGAPAAQRIPDVQQAMTASMLQQASRVQTILSTRLDEARRQVELLETALQEEKGRSAQREATLRNDLVALQNRLEAALGRAFALERENKVLTDELARLNGVRGSAIDGTVAASASASTPTPASGRRKAVCFASRASERAPGDAPAHAPAHGDAGAALGGSMLRTGDLERTGHAHIPLPRCEDEFDTFLLNITSMSRRLNGKMRRSASRSSWK